MGTAGVEPGEVLAGKYRIDRVLGEGGMGVVVAAHHLQLDEHVAIKFLLPEALSNEDAVARFAREARAAVKIKSEHVARVIDVGTLETGAPYMVMEYLDGSDLATLLEKNGPLPISDAVDFMLQTCEALADAHALGIIHRDLKPANLFCIRASDGLQSIKVLDFGISKLTGAAATGAGMAMTRTTTIMGSPMYMSPEQMQSARTVDVRTDVWAVGVILYELLTGRPPFLGETIPELCVNIMTCNPEPLQQLRTDVPDGLNAVVLRCLTKDRAKRYPNVAALAVDLRPFGPARSKASVERTWRILSASSTDLVGSIPPSVASPGTGRAPPSEVERRSNRVAKAVHGVTAATFGRTLGNAAPRPFRVGALAGVFGLALALGIGAGIFLLRKSPTPHLAAVASAVPGKATADSVRSSTAPGSPAMPMTALATAESNPKASAPALPALVEPLPASSSDKPVTKEPAAQELAAQEPAAQKPTVQKPVVQKPVTAKPATTTTNHSPAARPPPPTAPAATSAAHTPEPPKPGHSLDDLGGRL